MALADAYNLAQNQAFVQRVQAAIVTAADNVSSEVANEVQSIIDSGATAGTFTLTFGGQTTSALNWNATPSQVQTALAALSSIGAGNVVCTGGPLPGAAIAITFTGTLGNLPQLLITHTDTLTGGSIAVSRTTTGVAFVNHTARQALASKILANPSGYASLMAIGVSINATIQTDFPGPAYVDTKGLPTSDNDIQFQVNSIFNAYT